MKTEKINRRNLTSIFLKEIGEKDLPEINSEELEIEKKSMLETEKKIEQFEHDIAIQNSKYQNALLENLGFSSKTYLEHLTERSKATKKFVSKNEKDLNEYLNSNSITMQTGGLETLLGANSDCKTFEVRVCPEKVCVANPISIPVTNILKGSGFDGSFTKTSENSFRANDAANGSSSWNLTYHRHSTTHSGTIIINSGTEINEQSKVLGMGMRFKQLPNLINGGCASGDIHMFTPNSWGHVKMFYKPILKFKLPQGLSWIEWFNVTKIKYHDIWNEQGIYVPGGCGEHWHHNVLGSYGSHNLIVNRYDIFPAGTQFNIQVQLSYWIKGNGEGGGAGAFYALEVDPYIDIESCSMELPDRICVDVPKLD